MIVPIFLPGCLTWDSPAGNNTAQPAAGAQAGPASGGDGYHCFMMRTRVQTGTLCFAAHDRCEAERAQARRDGAATSNCGSQAPVACFQLGGNDDPSMEMCASSIEDCETWRYIDQDKNHSTGSACAWRHGADPAAKPATGDKPAGI